MRENDNALKMIGKVIRDDLEKNERVSCSAPAIGSVLPSSIEQLVVDSSVPSLWFKATGKNYDSSKHPCINDLRRFALVAMYHYVEGKQNRVISGKCPH